MKALFFLAALLGAQEALEESRPKSPEPVAGALDFPSAAPVPSSEPVSAPVRAGELDFLFPGEMISRLPPKAPEIDTTQPMIDKKEAPRPVLAKGKTTGFITEGGEKRGFKKVSFSPNRRASTNAASPSAAATAALLYGVRMNAGQNVFAMQQQLAALLPPGSLGAIMMSGAHSGHTAQANRPQKQVWSVGHTIKTKGGYTATMVKFDGSKRMGERHTWKITDKEGNTHYEYSSPLILDLDGDGVRMSRRVAKIDVNGDGKKEYVSEISAGDGLLVFDADKDGVSGENGREAFGDSTDLDGDGKRDGYLDGFEALLALAKKAGHDEDDVLDEAELAKLEKSHGLRIKVGGVLKKAVALSEAGVTTIWLPRTESKTVKDFDGQGNKTTRREGAVFAKKDGTTGSYEDVWFEL